MGGGSSTEYITPVIEVRADPQLLANLEAIKAQTQSLKGSITKLEQDIEVAKIEASKKSDPKYFQQLQEEAFDRFVDHIGTMDFKKPIQKQSILERHHILIGNISSGKSSLLNKFFGLKQPVGIGQCTAKPKAVTKIGNVTIWDSPGMNEDFKIYDPNVLAFFYCADKIFILYSDSLKSILEVLKVLVKIKPNYIYLIRTQTDNWNSKMTKTIKEELQTDISIVEKLGLKLPVYATSAKKEMDFQDNKTVYDLIRSP